MSIQQEVGAAAWPPGGGRRLAGAWRDQGLRASDLLHVGVFLLFSLPFFYFSFFSLTFFYLLFFCFPRFLYNFLSLLLTLKLECVRS